jgi:hypothetical protein
MIIKYKKLPGRSPFPDVTHQAFKSFCRISVCTHTAIPEVILKDFGLPFSSSRKKQNLIAENEAL